MVTFSDKFDVADASLNGVGGWQNSNQVGGGDVVTSDRYATQTGATSPTSTNRRTLAFQTTTEPEENTQELSIQFTSAVQGATNDGVLLGAYGDYDATYDSSCPGVWAAFRYMASGQRRLELWENWSSTGPDNGTRLAFVDLVLSGSVEASGYEGLLHDKGEAAVVQELHLRVEHEQGGVRLKAWLNSQDSDHPILSVLSKSDMHNVTGKGEWWFGIIQDSIADGSVAVTSFDATDVAAASAPTKAPVLLGNFPTLGELKQDVMDEYASSQNIETVPSRTLTRAINDGLREVLNTVGDVAWWMTAVESFSLTFAGNRTASLPGYVKRVINVKRNSDGCEVAWKQAPPDSSGNVVIWTLSQGTLDYEYVIRHEEASEDADQIPIPREHKEAVVLAAALRLARRDNNPSYVASVQSSLSRMMDILMNDVNRSQNMRRTVMRPRRTTGRPYGFPIHHPTI